MVLKECLHRIIILEIVRRLSLYASINLDEARQGNSLDLLLISAGLIPILFEVQDYSNISQTLIDCLVCSIHLVFLLIKAKFKADTRVYFNVGNCHCSKPFVVYHASQRHSKSSVFLWRCNM